MKHQLAATCSVDSFLLWDDSKPDVRQQLSPYLMPPRFACCKPAMLTALLANSSECQYRVFHDAFSAVYQSSFPQCCSCGACTACCMGRASCSKGCSPERCVASALVSRISNGCFTQSCGFLLVPAKCGHSWGMVPAQAHPISHMAGIHWPPGSDISGHNAVVDAR